VTFRQKLKQKVKLFWDIDGTLLSTNGAAALPFSEAIFEYSGMKVVIDKKKLSGYTDYEIAKSLLDSMGMKTNLADITIILNNYAKKLPQSLNNASVEKIYLVESILKTLLLIPEAEIAIGTGNFLPGAIIKLSHVGLLNYFHYENIFCASEKYWSRNLIINKAKNSIKSGQIGVVIGDSPKDIISAQASGLKSIAVTTGSHSHSELSEFKPDWILRDKYNIEDLIFGINNLAQ
jgi:phosphoglycolate phosphatase-like HAD superfamily hydrolase